MKTVWIGVIVLGIFLLGMGVLERRWGNGLSYLQLGLGVALLAFGLRQRGVES